MADYFTFYVSWRDAIAALPNDVRLEIYEAAIEYAASGEAPALKSIASVAFNFIKDDLDRQSARVKEISSKRSEAVRQRWKKLDADSEKIQMNTNDTKVDFVFSENTNDTNYKIEKNKKRIEEEKDPLSVPSPSGADGAEREKFLFDFILWEFFRLNRKNIVAEARRFYDFYSSQGWKKSGGQKITDIAAAVRIWKCREDAAKFNPEHLAALVEMFDLAEPGLRAVLAQRVFSFAPDGDSQKLTCTEDVYKYIEGNLLRCRTVLTKHFGEGVRLVYNVKK